MCLSASFPSNHLVWGLKDLLTAAEQLHYSLTKPLISYFIVSVFFSPPTEQHCVKRRGEISREDYMLTCKITPELLLYFPWKAWYTAPCFGLSHGYWVSQLKLSGMEILFPFFFFFPQDIRHLGHGRWHKGISSDYGTFFFFKAYFTHCVETCCFKCQWLKHVMSARQTH